MRIDNAGINEIIKSNIGMEVKGSATVGTVASGVKNDMDTPEVSYGVTATTVEKALFSLESELEKIQQDAGSLDVDLIKRQMAVLSNTLTGEEARRLQEEGYSLNDTQVETIVTVVDKIKMELAKGGMDISVFGDDLSMEQLEAMTGSAMQAKQMARSLTNCQDGDITYLLENELEPTIENLYWAQHSGSGSKTTEKSRLPEDSNLQKQVEQIIAQAGLPVNETTLGYGAMLLEHEIPLTPENISYVNQLKTMTFPVEEKVMEQAMSEAVSMGKEPKEAYLLPGYGAKDRAVSAMEVMEQADDAVLAAVAAEGEAFTIANLSQAEKGKAKSTDATEIIRSAGNVDRAEGKFITARRQLEEIRLMMTVEANYQLLKKGISIETVELEQLVEELKELENDYYKSLLQEQNIEPTTENVALFKETTEKTESLKGFPSYILGQHTLETVTVQELYEDGNRLAAVLNQANEAYETLMTAPRRDLGDSIQTAFRNVDDILADLELEAIPTNQRAVRILAYNQMEITTENINQIKAADEKMQNLFQNLKPSVVVELIRKGINPLQTDVVALNQKAEEIAAQLDPGQEEKYSEYLWKLEQNHEITPEEKESYIGIYRLLRQIEKTDGAVIGAVVNQGGDLSLRNLLTAVRTRRTNGMDVTIDNKFGMVEEITISSATISQQIEAAYQTDCAKEAFKQLTPEQLQQSISTGEWQNLTPEQLLWQIKEQQVQAEQETRYHQQQTELFGNNQTAEEAVLQMLKDYNMPVDTYHIMAVGQMVNNRNSIFRKLFHEENLEKNPDLQQVKEDILKEFAEAIKTPEDMAKAQLALAETAEHVMESMINEREISSQTVRDLKLLRTEIELSSAMSKEENYAVPVLIADEMTNVQLKIVRGKKTRGMVDVLFETERLGKVAARLRVSEERTEGFFVSDRGETIELLKQQEEQLKGQLAGQEQRELRFDYLFQEDLNLAEFTEELHNRNKTEANGEEYRIQTKELYSFAKVFIETVKRAA